MVMMTCRNGLGVMMSLRRLLPERAFKPRAVASSSRRSAGDRPEGLDAKFDDRTAPLVGG